MKVELLVNLRINEGVIPQGKVFDDSVEAFPEYVTNNLDDSRIIKVLVKDAPAAEAAPKKLTKAQEKAEAATIAAIQKATAEELEKFMVEGRSQAVDDAITARDIELTKEAEAKD